MFGSLQVKNSILLAHLEVENSGGLINAKQIITFHFKTKMRI